MNRYRVRSLAMIAALAAAPAAAQVPLTPRALGLGNGYVAAARGSESLWLNPANLGLPGTSHWSFSVPTLAVGADILGLGIGDVKDLADYNNQTDQRKQEILDEIPATGTDVRGEIRIPLIAAQIRHFAVGVGYTTLGNHTLQKDFVDLLVFGFTPQPGRYDINPQLTQGFRAGYVDVAAAYGRRIPVSLTGALSAGATVHYYRGGGLVRSGIVRVDTVRNGLGIPTDLQVTYAGVKDKGGSGFGVDLGAAFQPMPTLTFSASVSNVLNTFSWDGGERTVKNVVLTRTDYNNGDIQDILDRYDASEASYAEGSGSAAVQALAGDLGVDTDLPRTLRAGAAFEPRTGTLLTAGYSGDLGESRTGGLWDTSLGVGVQQRVAFLQARVGVASNLDSGTLLSGGLSLGPIHLGVARLNDGSANGFDRGGWVATFGLGNGSQSRMP